MVKNAVLTATVTVLIIVGAYLAVPLPGTPAPIVLTNFFILLSALLLGWKRATLGVLIYLLLGVLGMPVFANGTSGISRIAGATGGFLLGYILIAFCTGVIGKSGKIVYMITAVVAGSLAIYVIGLPWMKMTLDWTWETTLAKGMTPFIAGDTVKAIAAVVVAKITLPVLKPFLENDE